MKRRVNGRIYRRIRRTLTECPSASPSVSASAVAVVIIVIVVSVCLFVCLPAKPVFIQALERQFFHGFGDFRRLGVRRYMAQTRPSERIRMHPIASERIRAGPNRSKHVPELPKTSENSRKLQKICEKFWNFFAIVAFVPSFVLVRSHFGSRLKTCTASQWSFSLQCRRHLRNALWEARVRKFLILGSWFLDTVSTRPKIFRPKNVSAENFFGQKSFRPFLWNSGFP